MMMVFDEAGEAAEVAWERGRGANPRCSQTVRVTWVSMACVS